MPQFRPRRRLPLPGDDGQRLPSRRGEPSRRNAQGGRKLPHIRRDEGGGYRDQGGRQLDHHILRRSPRGSGHRPGRALRNVYVQHIPAGGGGGYRDGQGKGGEVHLRGRRRNHNEPAVGGGQLLRRPNTGRRPCAQRGLRRPREGDDAAPLRHTLPQRRAGRY